MRLPTITPPTSAIPSPSALQYQQGKVWSWEGERRGERVGSLLNLAHSENELEINRFKKKEKERQHEEHVEPAAPRSPTKGLCSPGSTI